MENYGNNGLVPNIDRSWKYYNKCRRKIYVW